MVQKISAYRRTVSWDSLIFSGDAKGEPGLRDVL